MKFSAVIADICERTKALEEERINVNKAIRLHYKDCEYIFCLLTSYDNPQFSVWSRYDNPEDSADFEFRDGLVKVLNIGKYTHNYSKMQEMLEEVLEFDCDM